MNLTDLTVRGAASAELAGMGEEVGGDQRAAAPSTETSWGTSWLDELDDLVFARGGAKSPE
ncbi:MAG: hypothetical protein ACQERF_08415 [Actinomycetota bacterium]